MCLRRALGVEGGRGAVYRVGGGDHLSELFNGTASFIAHLVEVVGLGELAEQMGDIGGYVRIVEAELAFVAVADSLLEKGFERMSLESAYTPPMAARAALTPVRQRPAA